MRTPERFRTDLGAALVAHAAGMAATPPRPPRRARSRRQIAKARLVPGAVLAALIIAAVLVIGSGASVSPQPASAPSVLRASAAALERSAPSLVLGRGDYLYTRVRVWWHYFDLPHRPVVRSIDETWTARDGAGRARERVLDPSRFTRPFAYDQALRRVDRPFMLDPYVRFSYAELQYLPARPARLASVVGRLADRAARRYGGTAPPAVFHSILVFSMLREILSFPAPAAARAAAYRVLATTPGIRLVGRGDDLVGRSGMVLTDTMGAFRLELIVDPSSGRLLQSSRTLLRRSREAPGWEPGLINRATYEAVAVVRSTHARPH